MPKEEVSTRDYGGVYVHCPVLFEEGGQRLDHDTFREMIRILIAVATEVPCIINPVSVELMYLSDRERVEFLTCLREETSGRALAGPVAMGAGRSMSTDNIIRSIQEAAEIGLDFVKMKLPDHFSVDLSDAEILSFFQSAASAADIDLIIYNSPRRSGRHITSDVIMQLLESCPRIVAIEEFDFSQSQRLLARAGEQLVICPAAPHQVPGLLLGSRGFYASFVWILAPRLMVETLTAAKRGDLLRVRQLYLDNHPLFESPSYGGVSHVALMKYLLERSGFPSGGIRRPFTYPPEHSARAYCDSLLSQASRLGWAPLGR